MLISQFWEWFQWDISDNNVEWEKTRVDIPNDLAQLWEAKSNGDKMLQEEAEDHQCELNEAESMLYSTDFDGDGRNDRVISTIHQTPVEIDTDWDWITDSVRQDNIQNIDTDCDGEPDLSLHSYTINTLGN